MNFFEIGGVKFLQVEDVRVSAKSKINEFVIVKDDATLSFYESLRPHLPKAIMEIGMYEGGSLVYFDKLFKPTNLVGLDRRSSPIEPLEDYRRPRPHIRTFYARFQDKPGTLQAARQCFPHGIDLVIDDASRLYRESSATFDMLFPLVREGGHYVIERWRGPQGLKTSENGGQPPPSQMVYELIDQLGRTPAIENIEIRSHVACVRRGPGSYVPEKAADAEPFPGQP